MYASNMELLALVEAYFVTPLDLLQLPDILDERWLKEVCTGL